MLAGTEGGLTGASRFLNLSRVWPRMNSGGLYGPSAKDRGVAIGCYFPYL